MAEEVETTACKPDISEVEDKTSELLRALHRLDALLGQAVEAAQHSYGPEAALDRFGGLHISPAEVEQLLARQPGISPLRAQDNARGEPDDAFEDNTRLTWLAAVFGLSSFDLDIIMIALAPELDLRYERLYAYLQDDVSRRRPYVDLALNLLCTTSAERLARLAHFDAAAPLLRHEIIRLIPDPHQPEPPLLANYLKLDDQIVRLLLDQPGLDRRLAPFCRMIWPTASWDELPFADELRHTLPALVSAAYVEHRPLTLFFHGPRGIGKRHTTEALAAHLGTRLLVADLEQLPPADLPTLARLVVREAWFEGAVLYIDNLDALRGEERSAQLRALLAALVGHTGVAILAGELPWVPTADGPLGVISVPFMLPTVAQARAHWQNCLAHEGAEVDDGVLDLVAGRFRLTPRQVQDAAALACSLARWRAALSGGNGAALPLADQMLAAARGQSGHDLAALAHKVAPAYRWDDIILPDDAIDQLREICQRVVQRERVLGEWGFGAKLSLGKGVNALFAGPSGTGKTMAAEVIANELGLDLYKIDLAGVVSKYIGETEKNLDRIFTAAERSNAILFFDEADALFGKRSEVRDSHDRYANVEISYLLQKMEQYAGITILATNLRQNLDEAFVRRLTFVIHFPFPDEADRHKIWQLIWPARVSLAEDVDLADLARRFKLSGGNIKNIALGAAFLAADEGGAVTMAALRHATQREYQKLGKVLSEEELG